MLVQIPFGVWLGIGFAGLMGTMALLFDWFLSDLKTRKRLLFIVGFAIMAVVGLSLGIPAADASQKAGWKLRIQQNKQILQKMGITGPKTVKKSNHSSQITGSISGSFFIASGAFNGSLASEPHLTFYWEALPGVEYATTLPYRLFRFETDEFKDTPTAEFVFDRGWVESPHVTVTEKHPNHYLVPANLYVVVVRISTATKQKEIYLPN